MPVINDLVAVSDALAGDMAGASTWFQLSGGINADELRAAGVAAGIDADFMPQNTTPKTALRRACASVVDKRTLARNMAHGAWAIVREKPDFSAEANGETLTHEVIAIVKLEGSALKFEVCAWGDEIAQTIIAAYHKSLSELDAADLSAWLVGTADRIGAVALRDRGGVYFVPNQSVDNWRNVARVLRSQNSACDVYELPTLKSNEAIRSIVAAITREAEQAAADVVAKIESGDLGKRALRARGADCDKLTAKLAEYETLLGANLSAVKAQLTDVAAAATAAALIAEMEDNHASVEG